METTVVARYMLPIGKNHANSEMFFYFGKNLATL